MASGLPGPPEFPWYPLFSRLELEGEIPCRTLILSLQPTAECDSLNYSTKWMYPCYLMPLSTKSIFLNQHPLLWNTPTWAGFWGFITKSSHTCLPMLVFLFTFLSLLLCYPPPSSTYPIPSLFNANIWDLLLCCFFKLPSQSSLASVMLPLHIFAEVSLNAKTYFPILWIEGSTFLPQTEPSINIYMHPNTLNPCKPLTLLFYYLVYLNCKSLFHLPLMNQAFYVTNL